MAFAKKIKKNPIMKTVKKMDAGKLGIGGLKKAPLAKKIMK
jgi:hypothetical protein